MEAYCLAGAFGWARNTENQDPCQVASSLIALCNDKVISPPLLVLDKDQTYLPPTSDNQTPCSCSSVVYALVSACAACQDGNHQSWQEWTASCLVSPSIFPRSTSISIPPWASFSVQDEPSFNVSRARHQAQGDGPPTPHNSTTPLPTPTIVTPQSEITSSSMASPGADPTSATNEPTLIITRVMNTEKISASFPSHTSAPFSADSGTRSGVESTTSAGNSIFTQTVVKPSPQSTQSTELASNKSSNTGAIAGGTVAGIIVLLLTGAVLFWWLRRRRRSRMAPSAAYIAAYGTERPPTNVSHRPFQERSASPLVSVGASAPYQDDVPIRYS